MENDSKLKKEEADENYLNKTLMNGLKILEEFSENNTEMELKELVDAVELNKSSVWRLVYTLEHMGYLQSIPDENKYKLSFKGLNFARIILNDLNIREKALPYLKRLSEKLDLNVNLSMLAQDKAVLIATKSAPSIPDNYFHVGRELPLHATASGKVLLAFQPVKRREEILENLEMDELTKYTKTDKKELEDNLKEIRERGYAFDREEYAVNTRCLAFPIINDKGEITASLSVSSRKLKSRDELNMEEYLDDVAKIADDISYELGFGLFSPIG